MVGPAHTALLQLTEEENGGESTHPSTHRVGSAEKEILKIGLLAEL